jgi:hypothetical protein
MPSLAELVRDDEQLLTPHEAASLLKKSTATLACWRSRRRGPPYSRIEKTIRYKLGDLRRYVDEGTQQRPAART